MDSGHSSRRRRAARHRKKRILIALSSAFVLLLIIGPIVFVAMLTDQRSLVAMAQEVDPRAVVRVKQLSQQLENDLASTAEQASLTLNQDDLNGIVGVVSAASQRFNGRIDVTRWGLEGVFSLGLTQWFLGDYLNLRFGIAPSEQGFHLSYLSVGSFDFSGMEALDTAKWLANEMIERDVANLVLNAIDGVTMEGSEVTILYRPAVSLRKQFSRLQSDIRSSREDLGLLGNLDVVRIYYHKLCQTGESLPLDQDASLSHFMAAAFELAQQRALKNEDPVVENRAAILALGVALGSPEFEHFIGPVRDNSPQSCAVSVRNIELANRADLNMHFVYSATLTVLADSGISVSLTEFKKGLSREVPGFSFVNLLADRAGERFAKIALDDRGGALRLQTLAASLIDESVFFPSVDGLREGIPEIELEQRYGGVDGALYRGYAKDINGRLLTLPLYNRWLEK